MSGSTARGSERGPQLFACVVGSSEIMRHKMVHLSRESDPVTLIYPFWVVVRPSHVTVVDTGFSANVAAARGVRHFLEPSVLLGELGLTGGDVDDVIVTHLHYDHFSGGAARFPRARFFVQGADIDYFLRRGMRHPAAALADTETRRDIELLRDSGRLMVIDGDTRTDDALLIQVGGHTPGSQIVVLQGTPYPVVLASDASHLYQNARTGTPTALIHSYDHYQEGFGTILTLASGGQWFPGHDPLMLEQLSPTAPGVWELPSTPAGAKRFE